MCGFAGEFLLTDTPGTADVDLADRMAERLRHRGPDECGRFASGDGRCAIGFRRLAVIDPSGSHQPMSGAQGAVTLAFNGEIYNFRDLRAELAAGGYAFTTAGDTEVLLAMYLRHGLAMLDRLEGMFAAAIYDGRERTLHLIRDRVGIKPLWYAVADGRVVFASEAKALHIHPSVGSRVDLESLVQYLTLGYIHAPRSIWSGIRKLLPGSHVSFTAGLAEPQSWWEPSAAGDRSWTQAEAVDAVREAVSAAVTRRMVADVPLGALLSGGIDSSIVCALMCRATGDPAAVRTFSAGFAEGQFDERPYARRVAEHLGTRHAEVLIEPDAASIVDDLVRQYDEPFGDSSSLSTYLLCRQVREAVTVALVGDGGDEAFAGYDRHRAMWLTQHMSCIKGTLITAGGVLLDSFAPRDEKHPLRRFVRFARGMDAPAALRYLSYRQLLSLAELDDLLTDDLAEQINPATGRDWFTHLYEHDCGDSEMRNAQRHDVLTYLPDDLLVKADIASMAWGLELRSPFLDHHVIELGLALPDEFKVDRHRGKRILAAAFGDLLPAEVFDRPKAGFGVPIDTWLRGPLLPTLKETLLDQSFIDTGWLRRTAIERMIDRHVTGKADHRHPLWALLCLGRWYALQESRHSE